MLPEYEVQLDAVMQEERVNRLRFMILHHDALVTEVARWVGAINETAREFADADGRKVRPTIDQLRNELLGGPR